MQGLARGLFLNHVWLPKRRGRVQGIEFHGFGYEHVYDEYCRMENINGCV